jgi:hypothetical protein
MIRYAMLGLALVAIGAAPAGQWEITDKTAQLDGSRSYMALLQSDEAVANIISSQEKPKLGANCDKNGFHALVDWPDFIDKEYDETSVTVAWRIDDKPVMKTRWLAGDQLVALTGQKGLDWFAGLKGAKKLIVSVPDKHGGQEAVFSLEGVDQVIAQLSTMRCG